MDDKKSRFWKRRKRDGFHSALAGKKVRYPFNLRYIRSTGFAFKWLKKSTTSRKSRALPEFFIHDRLNIGISFSVHLHGSFINMTILLLLKTVTCKIFISANATIKLQWDNFIPVGVFVFSWKIWRTYLTDYLTSFSCQKRKLRFNANFAIFKILNTRKKKGRKCFSTYIIFIMINLSLDSLSWKL